MLIVYFNILSFHFSLAVLSVPITKGRVLKMPIQLGCEIPEEQIRKGKSAVSCKPCVLWEVIFQFSFLLRYFRHEKVVVSMQSRRCEWTHGKSTLPTHGTKSFAELGGDWCSQWWWWQWQWWRLMATMIMWDKIGFNCFDGDYCYDVYV